MATLSFKRYVDITSGVIGANGTKQRELIGRLFTTNPRMDADEILEMTTLADVGKRFGTDSEEYDRARFYFSWVSPAITKPSKISFGRYVPQEIPARIFGATAASLSSIQAVGTTASLTLTIGTGVYVVQDIDVSTDITTYADVASTLQTAIRASSTDNVITDSTVTFNSQNTTFEFVAGLNGNVDIAINDTPLAEVIGWSATDALLTAGHVQQSPSDSVELADSISNNYASVDFIDDLAIADHVAVATTLNAIDDTSYMYCVACTREDYPQWQSQLANLAGVAIGLIKDDDDTTNYVEMVPMIQTAATDYSRRNATSSYMYREFNLPVVVTDNTEASALDKLRINYYGKTQEAGRQFSFYQKGYLQGPDTAPLDQSVFANEIWLKSLARVEFMGLLRALQELPANESGRTFGMSTLQGIVDAALRNGVISIGKPLDNLKKAAIAQLSGDPDAWRQIQNVGYWMNVEIESFTNDAGLEEWRLTYVLIYSKKDNIRSVRGMHALV